MERSYKCIKEFSLDMYDGDENLLETKQKVIPVDSIWERQDYSSMADIRLEGDLGWLEIDDRTLVTHFVEI